MIRPATVLTALLAAGSGLYLYQAKHRTRVTDGQIAAIEGDIQTAETRISLLRAEWALENSPIRLADLAGRYLTLEPMKPSQAVSFAELVSRLPPPAPPGTTPAPPGGAAAPVLPVLASEPALAYYASLDILTGGAAPSASPSPAQATTEVATSDLAPAVAPAAPTNAPTIAPTIAPGAAVVAALAPAAPPPASPPAPRRAPPVPLIVPASAAAPVYRPVSARVTMSPARQAAAPVIAPVIATALGGAYPNLPPPAPLSGTH
jgi:hypothetical protein